MLQSFFNIASDARPKGMNNALATVRSGDSQHFQSGFDSLAIEHVVDSETRRHAIDDDKVVIGGLNKLFKRLAILRMIDDIADLF